MEGRYSNIRRLESENRALRRILNDKDREISGLRNPFKWIKFLIGAKK